jgi:hypothetical protein
MKPTLFVLPTNMPATLSSEASHIIATAMCAQSAAQEMQLCNDQNLLIESFKLLAARHAELAEEAGEEDDDYRPRHNQYSPSMPMVVEAPERTPKQPDESAPTDTWIRWYSASRVRVTEAVRSLRLLASAHQELSDQTIRLEHRVHD